ncbi:MAG: NAD-dependent epimerase/dehydratase family protein [Acidimicrobiia bacterium]
MSRIAVTGAAGPVGRRVCARLLADPDVAGVVAIDRQRLHLPDTTAEDRRRLEVHRVHLREADLGSLLADVDAVVHLAGSDPLEDTAVDHDLLTTGRVLAACEAGRVAQLVVRSSATVYGAHPDNPLPLTESAELRPNDGSPWVQMRARIEERVQAFADEHPDVAVAVLRPCVTVSESGPDELGRVLAAARVVGPGEDAPPAQFVHADDVAGAVDVVRRTGATGAFNVAPDGAVEAERLRALVGGSPRIPLPGWLASRLSDIGWRYRLAPTPPGFVPFAREPWVVANDRLRALGWAPSLTNDEAYVAGHAAAPWAQISPQRRQELALGVAGAVLVGTGTAAAVALRRRLR